MNQVGFLIEPMTMADVPLVVWLEDKIFSDPWSRDSFSELVANPRTINFVARSPEPNNNIVAYAMSVVVADELQVYNVAVLPDFRRAGLGRRLVLALEETGMVDGARQAILDVRVGNEPARKLYESLGYRELMRRPRYYRSPIEDAIVMVKKLVKQPSRTI